VVHAVFCTSPLWLKPCNDWAFNEIQSTWYVFTKNQQSQHPTFNPYTLTPLNPYTPNESICLSENLSMKEAIMSSNLAVKLRSGTQKAHTSAENVGFMKCFLKGVVDRQNFAKFLSNLYFVYSELEAAITSHVNNPVIAAVYFPELNRRASLEKDMVFYYGSEWRSLITPSSSTQAYINHIRELSARDPVLLIGHTYTRYMGDLSGGQMLQKIAQSTLKLSGYEGTSFYNFEQIPDKQAFKNTYRQAMDSLSIDDATGDRIVVEANSAFQFNMQMAKDLEGSLIKAIGQVVFNSLTQTNNPGSTEAAAM
jgi:heme oxygenase (biliverdin-producing, ferredoxin)